MVGFGQFKCQRTTVKTIYLRTGQEKREKVCEGGSHTEREREREREGAVMGIRNRP